MRDASPFQLLWEQIRIAAGYPLRLKSSSKRSVESRAFIVAEACTGALTRFVMLVFSKIAAHRDRWTPNPSITPIFMIRKQFFSDDNLTFDTAALRNFSELVTLRYALMSRVSVVVATSIAAEKSSQSTREKRSD